MVLHYEHNNEKDNFFIDCIQLQESDSKRDHGVIFSTDFQWNNIVFTDGECFMKQLICDLFINENH